MITLRPLHCDVLVSSSESRIRVQIAGIAAAMTNVVGHRPKRGDSLREELAFVSDVIEFWGRPLICNFIEAACPENRLSPRRGFLCSRYFPRLAPWAAFLRRIRGWSTGCPQHDGRN
jgi:hypothetical protein